MKQRIRVKLGEKVKSLKNTIVYKPNDKNYFLLVDKRLENRIKNKQILTINLYLK